MSQTTSSSDTNVELLRTGKLLDCAVVSGTTELLVHQKIICPQSPFLQQLCAEGFEVNAESPI
jgi:hypothetical protein